MPKIPSVVSKYMAEIGRKGRAVMSEAQIEASRRNGCNNTHGIPDSAQIAAFREVVAAGGRPRLGPRLHRVLKEAFATEPKMLRVLGECRVGRQTVWTLLNTAKAKAGLKTYTPKPRKA